MKIRTYLTHTLLLLFALAMMSACKSNKPIEMNTSQIVKNLDLQRYAGKWYEIARMPFFQEKDMMNTTATYKIRPDGKIKVTNEGYKFSKDGKHKKATAVAWIPDPAIMGQLKVRFFWPFTGDYHIVALDTENYSYAMVKSGGLLWILAREPQLDNSIYNSLVEKANSLGIETEKLIKVEQDW